MHQQRVQSLRHRQAHESIMCGEYESAEQARRDVVAVATAARGEFAFKRMRIQGVEGQRRVEQGIRRDQCRNRRRRRAAHAGTERDAFLDLECDAELRIDRGQQRRNRTRRRVLLDLARQRDRQAADGIDAHAVFARARRDDTIARTLERMTNEIEADGAVADAGRREGDGAVATHTRAPR